MRNAIKLSLLNPIKRLWFENLMKKNTNISGVLGYQFFQHLLGSPVQSRLSPVINDRKPIYPIYRLIKLKIPTEIEISQTIVRVQQPLNSSEWISHCMKLLTTEAPEGKKSPPTSKNSNIQQIPNIEEELALIQKKIKDQVYSEALYQEISEFIDKLEENSKVKKEAIMIRQRLLDSVGLTVIYKNQEPSPDASSNTHQETINNQSLKKEDTNKNPLSNLEIFKNKIQEIEHELKDLEKKNRCISQNTAIIS